MIIETTSACFYDLGSNRDKFAVGLLLIGPHSLIHACEMQGLLTSILYCAMLRSLLKLLVY